MSNLKCECGHRRSDHELRSGESRMWACNVCGRQCRHDLMAWLPNPQGGELSLCRGCSSVGTMEVVNG